MDTTNPHPLSQHAATFTRQTVLVRDLRAGDVFTTQKGERLTVASVDVFGACAIVDFTDSTATAPVMALSQAVIDRPAGQVRASAHPTDAEQAWLDARGYDMSTNA